MELARDCALAASEPEWLSTEHRVGSCQNAAAERQRRLCDREDGPGNAGPARRLDACTDVTSPELSALPTPSKMGLACARKGPSRWSR